MAYEERVTRGAEWLDAVHPGWERQIDVTQLRLSNPCRCVLGQLTGDFNHIGNVAVNAFNGIVPAERWMNQHGFNLSIGESIHDSWRQLEADWTLLIKERFDSGTLSDD